MFIILEHLGDDVAIEADDILRLKRGREPGTFRPLVEVLGYSEATGLFNDYTFGTLEEVTERVNAARSQKRTQASSKSKRNPAKDINPTPIPTRQIYGRRKKGR